MRKAKNPFVFCTSSHVVLLTGERAYTLPELLVLLKNCSGSSIFQHTFHHIAEHHFTEGIFPNDFTQWVTSGLGLKEFGEKLASIDVCDFSSVRSLRNKIVNYIEDYISGNPNVIRKKAKNPFYLREAKTVVIKAGLIAKNLKEFLKCLKEATLRSVYYHLIEARVRLGLKGNDFSEWLRNELNLEPLSKQIEQVDFLVNPLEHVKERIINLVEEEVGKK